MAKAVPTVVDLVKASKYYRRGGEIVTALESASFTVAEGELAALMGPSGCGKTTSLNLVAGIDRADTGQVRVCGKELGAIRESELDRMRRRVIGFIFQAFHLMPHLTVEENVALPLSLDRRKDPGRVRGLIARVGLSHRLGHYPSELSGGEQQRAAVARALVSRPALLLADEPTGNLDSHNGQAILALLDELRREEGTALLIATHDERVTWMADRVIRLEDGRVKSVT